MSPADSFATAIGVGIGNRYRRRYRTDQPDTAKLLADRVATLSELRWHGHNTIEQCLLLAVVVCGQRIAHQRARPESQRTPAPSHVRFQTTGVDPRSSLCRFDGRRVYVQLIMTEWHMACSLSIPIPIATPTPIALRRCLDSVV
ncbi:MAG: hypothetical protein N838_05955 [Thiohalocapsa sp. PB-PSB1]|nr:MAG: hypothetical protein N838_05955 [Thiohalocapsa sp. PB-PSB1]